MMGWHVLWGKEHGVGIKNQTPNKQKARPVESEPVNMNEFEL